MLLEHLQADFANALIDADAASELAPALLACKTRALERLALYRADVHATWKKALVSAYPVVHSLVGEEFFAALSRAYGRACPSSSGDLNRFGARFVGFVRTFEHARSLPYLGDVAALEWLVHTAHYAADARAITREALAALAPQELLASRFRLHPACAWIESRFPIATLWRAHQEPSAVAWPALERPEYALVTRPLWRANVVESTAAEVAALEKLRIGGDMDSAIGAALAKDARFDLGKALVRWLDLAVIVECAAQSSNAR
jgi:hypothetical protein